MKKFICFIFCLILFSIGNCTMAATEDLYAQQIEQSGANQLSRQLPNDAKELLNILDADIQNPNWVNTLDVQSIFELLQSIVSGNIKSIFLPCVSVVGFILLSYSLNHFFHTGLGEGMQEYVSVLGACVLLIFPFISIISVVAKAIQSGCVFMLSFIPVYCGILVSNGQVATSAGFSAVMLGATELISFIAAYIVTPLAGIYLALRISFSISSSFNLNGVIHSIKKIAVWILSFILLVFLGLLKIQTTVHTATDTLSLSATKFIVGSSVPLVGSAVGEAISAVKGCISLLGSSVGTYAILAFLCVLLPVFLQLLLWRLGIGLCITVAELFACQRITDLMRAVEDTLSFLIAVVACSAIFFVVAITFVSVGSNV